VDAQGSRGDTAFAPNAPIAAALGKAQAERNNPEKSVAFIFANSPRRAGRRDDAASAPSGLMLATPSEVSSLISAHQTCFCGALQS
jgi:hypothetical protein